MAGQLEPLLIEAFNAVKEDLRKLLLQETPFEDDLLPPGAGGTGVDNGTNTLTLGASVTLNSTPTDGTGVTGRVAQWNDTNTLEAATLIKSGAGVLTLAASGTATLTVSGSINVSGTGAATDEVLAYDGTTFVPTPLSVLGALDGSGTAGRVAQWNDTNTLEAATLAKSGAGVLTLAASGAFTLTVPATGTATLGTGTSGRITEWGGTNTVQASTLAKSGAGVLTLSAASAYTLTISGSINLSGASAATDEILAYNGTAFVPTGLGDLGAVNGSGTSGRMTQWNDADTLEASTLIKSGAGVLTLSASGAFTLTVPATGTTVLGTGTSGRVAQWSGTNTLQASTLVKSGAGVLTLSAGGTATLTLQSNGELAMNGNRLWMGADWDLSTFQSSGDAALVGFAWISINGVSHKIGCIA